MTATPPRIWREGDRCLIRYAQRDVEGMIVIASSNGVSLLVSFEAVLGSYVGRMALIWDGDGFYDLIESEKAVLKELVLS